MANSKKPKSKPAAKKKAAKKAAAHHPQSLAIAAIATLATRVSELAAELQSELKAANQKLNYVLIALAPRNREEWHPMVEEAERALENE
jgi:hypothetical protein